MALETEGRRRLDGLADRLRDGLSRTQQTVAASLPARLRHLALPPLRVPALVDRLLPRLKTTAVYRFFTRSLARRIFVSNLLGLLVLIGGILWLSKHHELLITAKRESLKVQGEIIAAAIAASPEVYRDRLSFDPDRLPEVEGPRLPYRDDRFAAFELSLRNDHVGPVLKKLIQTAQLTTRARVYDRDGELVVDTDTLFGPPKKYRGGLEMTGETPGQRVPVKTLWTRLTGWFDGSDLPVYREIGSANGNSYFEVRQALAGITPNPMLLLNEKGAQIVSLAVPIQRRNNTQGALLLSTPPGQIDNILAAERRVIYALALMAMLTTLMASMLLARTIAGPVHRLSAAADNVSRSINARADLPDYSDRQDEVGQMAGAIRRMTATLYKRIEASEKFAADVAHELKNPLTAAQSTAESLIYAKTPEQRNQCVTQIRGELKRLNRLITDVANASRLDAELARQTTRPVDLAEVLTGIVDVFRDLGKGDNVTVRLAIDPEAASQGALMVKGHDGRLGQVVTNLVDNAISFSSEGSNVTVTAARIGSEVEFAIVDEGPGMPEDKLEQVFERFYSDRPESDRTRGKNSGLGLSISREIIAAHGGRIWAENRRGPPATTTVDAGGHPSEADEGSITGARFVVRLPALIYAPPRGQLGFGRRPT
ncbi:MAG: stimulus-sensing domain-containing protein [Hyphomicrobiaceae bacterium]